MDDKTILEIRQKRMKNRSYSSLSMEYQLPLCTIRAICKNHERRYAFGINAGSTKLTDQNVKTIRDLISQGFCLKQIASLYSVSISTISDINTKRSWEHLP